MPPRTYHVAIAFQCDADGELYATDVAEAPTPQSAIARARQFARKAKGAAAFSRTGDTDKGLYGKAKIHLAIGELPADVVRYSITEIHVKSS